MYGEVRKVTLPERARPKFTSKVSKEEDGLDVTN